MSKKYFQYVKISKFHKKKIRFFFINNRLTLFIQYTNYVISIVTIVKFCMHLVNTRTLSSLFFKSTKLFFCIYFWIFIKIHKAVFRITDINI